MKNAAGDAARRDDVDIFAEARSALDRRPEIPATVHVHIDQGIATLTGSVRLPSERMAAEDTVRHIAGVRRVINEIMVAAVASAEGFEPPDDRG